MWSASLFGYRNGARIVNNRSMPDVNCQHMIAMALVDGKVTFASTRSTSACQILGACGEETNTFSG